MLVVAVVTEVVVTNNGVSNYLKPAYVPAGRRVLHFRGTKPSSHASPTDCPSLAASHIQWLLLISGIHCWLPEHSDSDEKNSIRFDSRWRIDFSIRFDSTRQFDKMDACI